MTSPRSRIRCGDENREEINHKGLRTMEPLLKKAVVVFAKVPGKENPKSRIAAEAGLEKADIVYSELLSATALQVKEFDHFISFTGCEEPGPLRRIFPGARAFLIQQDGTLGRRVKDALCEVRARGYALLCALGTDCPWLTPEEIDRSFSMLAGGAEVVVGPAEDGGYYLIALKDPCIGVFSVKGWGTADLLYETMRLMNDRKIRYTLLDSKEDIDTFEAYARWKATHPPRNRETGL